METEPLSYEDFSDLVDQTFQISYSERSVEMTLLEAKEGKETFAGRTSFSLVFQAAPGTTVAQATYQIHHEKIGTHAVFMVPGMPTENGPLLEAVFN